MDKIKVLFMKYWIICWTNKWIKNVIIFVAIFTPLIIIDQVTKAVNFNGDKSGLASPTISDWKIIAFRSQFHTSTTFLDFIGSKLPLWTSLLIDYLLIIVFASILAFNRKKYIVIAISIALAGVIGNTIDASALHGVRNVFFIPWMDRGTFNFADLIIVIGAVSTGLGFMYDLYQDSKNKKDKK